MTERVAVVGGGAVGVTAALALAERGADVTLYEREDLASGASGRAAGIVYDAFAEDRDAAIAARALERFRALDDAGAVSLTSHPYVWLAREGDDSATEAIREQVPRMREHGRDVALLSAADLNRRFPALATDHVAVAAVANDAGYLDPPSYVTAMGQRARESGANICTGVAARLDDSDPTTVRTPDGSEQFDAVLVAAGAHSARVLADAGYAIAMKPYRVQALVTTPLSAAENGGRGLDATAVPTTYDATGGYYLRPYQGGLLVGDGTEEREFDPDDYDETADDAFCERSISRVRAALAGEVPDLSVRRAWAGLCTATPDRNPLLGPVGTGLFVATGWHGHGFMRAPALGETVAEQMLGGEGVRAFDPRRFDGDERFDVVEGMTVDEYSGY